MKTLLFLKIFFLDDRSFEITKLANKLKRLDHSYLIKMKKSKNE